MTRKKIMVFAIPNDGHLNILKRLVGRYRSAYDFRMVLVDQRTTAPDLRDLPAPVVVPQRCRGFLNTPASEVFQRVDTLLGECLAAARTYRPDLIVYDFCALEGRLVGQILDIPSWCSVPGLMGPFVHRDHVVDCVSSPANRRAIAALQRRFRVDIDPGGIELVSNCLHLPAEVNLLWSYPSVTPRDFRHNRRAASYRFVGYLSDGHRRQPSGAGPTVYLSFGTEVMNNLWPADEATRRGVRRCVAGLARRWRTEMEVVFATQGQPVLDEYPENWTVRDQVDQQATLSRADVFVTHGGSNSFHEAILLQVPMVVVPFFGDQPLVAQRVEELGLGIGLVADRGIDRDKPKNFLDAALPSRIADAVAQVLADDAYRRAFARLALASTPPLDGLDEDTAPEITIGVSKDGRQPAAAAGGVIGTSAGTRRR